MLVDTDVVELVALRSYDSRPFNELKLVDRLDKLDPLGFVGTVIPINDILEDLVQTSLRI
jgi:hypothetical protein